jgi:hypothetical protein
MTQPDTGESTASINRRADDAAWPRIEERLKETGATLLRIPKLKRAYADCGRGPEGAGISDTRVRHLEKDGVIKFVGVDRYMLLAQREVN